MGTDIECVYVCVYVSYNKLAPFVRCVILQTNLFSLRRKGDTQDLVYPLWLKTILHT